MPQPDHIIRVALPDENTLSDGLKKYFGICVEKLDMMPNPDYHAMNR
tara:strand:- start:634 stop:774 length:141 start_codon:yes stop_codon:yes gene_type:complete